MQWSDILEFYCGKRVFVTGHTGFKGSWLCKILQIAGAEVTGFALEPSTEPALFQMINIGNSLNSVIGDVRDYALLKHTFDVACPEIVFHLAAQPLVRESYRDPRSTYETNVMGTVNLLDCVRLSTTTRSFLNITTDKVYMNKEWVWGYREEEQLGGLDPYSNSKSCSELVTHSYWSSFFLDRRVAISTARAGNVIGGGDFAKDRIVPDCVRAALAKKDIEVRNPCSVRPYQHVLEPLMAYLMIAQRQYEDASCAGHYNIGPDDRDCFETRALVERFCKIWGEGLSWFEHSDGGPHEANYLKLDCAKIKACFGWAPRWNLDEAIRKTIEWTHCMQSGGNINAEMEREIRSYLAQDSGLLIT